MLDLRLRRRPNIKSTLGQLIVFTVVSAPTITLRFKHGGSTKYRYYRWRKNAAEMAYIGGNDFRRLWPRHRRHYDGLWTDDVTMACGQAGNYHGNQKTGALFDCL